MKRKILLAVAAVAVFIFMAGLTGCGGSGSALQTEPLASTDVPAVQRAVEKDGVAAPEEIGSTGFKMEVYGPTAAPVPNAPVDYLMEYRKRVASTGVTFFGLLDDEWKYSFAFPVVNGQVLARMDGLKAGTYKVFVYANSVMGLNFFHGEGIVEIKPGMNNQFAKVYLECQTTNSFGVKVVGLPADLDLWESCDVQTKTTTQVGRQELFFSRGYQAPDGFYFSATMVMYPYPANAVEYAVQGKSGQVYAQEFGFDILELIDRVDRMSYYEVIYKADSGLTIDFGFPTKIGFEVAPTGGPSGTRVCWPGLMGEEMLSMDLFAKDDPVAIQSVKLGLSMSNPRMNVVGEILIYDGQTLVGRGSLINSSSLGSSFVLQPAVYVPAHSVKTLRVKANFAPAPYFTANHGDEVALTYEASSGINEATGEMVKDESRFKSPISFYALVGSPHP